MAQASVLSRDRSSGSDPGQEANIDLPIAPEVGGKSHRSHFWRHFVEMILAMLVGMGVGRAVFGGIFAAAGMTYDQALVRYTAPCLIMMAFNMSVPMALWMRHRGHGWRSALEMSGAMFVPAIALVGLLWLHVLTSHGPIFALLHAAMLPAMLVVMLYRRSEYAMGAMQE